MKRRPVPVERPERWPFVRVNLEGVDGSPWVFRMPRSTQAAHVFGPWLESIVERDGKAEMRADVVDIEERCAAIVAQLWAHPELEFEPGASPIDELHDAGLSGSMLVNLVAALSAKSVRRIVSEKEVAARADFFGERESSTPTSSTSTR